MSMVMYGHDVHTLEANKLAAKARADGWTSLNWIAKNGDMWRLFGVPPGEPKHAWLKDGEAVAFTEPAKVSYSGASQKIRTDALENIILSGWTCLRWVDDRDHGLFHLVGKRPAEQKADGVIYLDDNGRIAFRRRTATTTRDADGPPRIRSELGGLMGPGYQATGYEPPPRRQVLLDDPTGDDIAGDVK